MHNFFTIETEAEMRRQDLLRMAADVRAASASRIPLRRRWPRASRSSANASALTLPYTPLGALLELRRVPRPVTC